MQEHAVPQQISSYEFRLVGDMTLKQFFQLAGGVLVSLIFYASSLPAIIKWPAIIFFAFLGVALAFLPFEERPLSAWIVAFFKAIYSPTKYQWQEGAAEDVYSAGPAPQVSPAPPSFAKATEGKEEPEPFAKQEANFFEKVASFFGTGPAVVVEETTEAPAPAAAELIPARPEIPRIEEIPEVEPVKVQAQEVPVGVPEEPSIPTPKVTPVLRPGQRAAGAQAAAFAATASPPSPPERPNTVVGQVQDATGKIIEGAILEIRDSQGIPVRALKTNKLGHFIAVTPLADGEYEIEIEKEGLSFPIIKFPALGNIIPPIQIKAK